MSLNSLQEIVGPSIVQEEYALAQAPQRSGTEFITACVALRNSFRQTRAHAVDCQVRIKIHWLLAQRCYRIRSSLERRRMAQVATDL